MTVLHSTALCGGCNCCVRGCTSSSVGLVTSTSSSQAQLSRVFTPRHRTLLHSDIFTLTSEQCSVEICCFTPLHGYTQLNSVIFTLTAEQCNEHQPSALHFTPLYGYAVYCIWIIQTREQCSEHQPSAFFLYAVRISCVCTDK